MDHQHHHHHHQSTGDVYTDDHRQALILSISTLLTNKIKLVVANPQKNKQLALNPNLANLLELITENLIPLYLDQNYNNQAKLNLMHNLVYLLASKV